MRRCTAALVLVLVLGLCFLPAACTTTRNVARGGGGMAPTHTTALTVDSALVAVTESPGDTVRAGPR